MKYKIALYGFGSFPVVYRHLIETARAERSSVEFCMILTGPTWRQVLSAQAHGILAIDFAHVWGARSRTWAADQR